MDTLPEVGVSRPFRWWIRVVLPEPLAPMIHTRSPAETVRVMSSRMVLSPAKEVRFLITIVDRISCGKVIGAWCWFWFDIKGILVT